MQAAIYAVVFPRANLHIVELTNGNVIVMVPVLHAIPGHIDATIVAQDHVIAIGGIDPKCMVIHMH